MSERNPDDIDRLISDLTAATLSDVVEPSSDGRQTQEGSVNSYSTRSPSVVTPSHNPSLGLSSFAGSIESSAESIAVRLSAEENPLLSYWYEFVQSVKIVRDRKQHWYNEILAQRDNRSTTPKELLLDCCSESQARFELYLAILRALDYGQKELGIAMNAGAEQLDKCCVCALKWVAAARSGCAGQKLGNYQCVCDVKHDKIPGVRHDKDTNLLTKFKLQMEKFHLHLKTLPPIGAVCPSGDIGRPEVSMFNHPGGSYGYSGATDPYSGFTTNHSIVNRAAMFAYSLSGNSDRGTAFLPDGSQTPHSVQSNGQRHLIGLQDAAKRYLYGFRELLDKEPQPSSADGWIPTKLETAVHYSGLLVADFLTMGGRWAEALPKDREPMQFWPTCSSEPSKSRGTS